MAIYRLTEDEFRQASFSLPGPRWKRIVAWSLSLGVLAASIFFGQYAFSVIWLALLIFVYITFYVMSPQMEANKLKNNPFALGPYEIEFRPESYTVKMGRSVFDLSMSEFGRAHRIDNLYRLDHKSHVCVVVPSRALSDDEIEIVESYRERFPGSPENKSTPDY